MLMHHADPGLQRVGGRLDLHRPAVDANLAAVLSVKAVKNLHQGGFAGAVLAQERMHLACFDIKIDMVAGQDARETLDDAAHFQQLDARQAGRQQGWGWC